MFSEITFIEITSFPVKVSGAEVTGVKLCMI